MWLSYWRKQRTITNRISMKTITLLTLLTLLSAISACGNLDEQPDTDPWTWINPDCEWAMVSEYNDDWFEDWLEDWGDLEVLYTADEIEELREENREWELVERCINMYTGHICPACAEEPPDFYPSEHANIDAGMGN
jgi:hypothetical protein